MGLWLSIAMFLSNFGYSLFHEHGCFAGFHIGRNSQKVIQAMILKKRLRLTQASSRNFPDSAIHSVNGAS